MRVRVPAILDEVIANNADFDLEVPSALVELREGLANGAPLPPLDPRAPHAAEWLAELALRDGQGWLSTDWFFAENYAYRQLIERTRYWAEHRDPFLSHKRAEYAGAAHARAFERALALGGAPEQQLSELLLASVLGNRMDLSFAAARERGTSAEQEDLLIDDRSPAIRLLCGGTGPVHLIVDNAGTELTLDLVLVDHLLEKLGARVVLHVKVHPAFVSDATLEDVFGFIGISGNAFWEERFAAWGEAARGLRVRLCARLEAGRLSVTPHAFWNGPKALWELPSELVRHFSGARLVLLKGDAHYRRAVNDAIWPVETPFAEVTRTFPAPLLALRMLKSDPVVGIPAERALAIEANDPEWKTNGKRGLISLGGGALDRHSIRG